jgi:hypothetical protein
LNHGTTETRSFGYICFQKKKKKKRQNNHPTRKTALDEESFWCGWITYYVFVSISLFFKMTTTQIQNAEVVSRKKSLPRVNRNGGCSRENKMGQKKVDESVCESVKKQNGMDGRK